MKFRSLLAWAAASLLLVGCASIYKPIRPETMRGMESSPSNGGPVEISYRHHVLSPSRNFVYDDKARRERFDVMAVHIRNITDRPLNTVNDLDFYIGGKEVTPEKAGRTPMFVRQKTGAYFWWMLLSPIFFARVKVDCDDYPCKEDVSYVPIGLIAGVILTGINAGISSASNTEFEKELVAKDIYGKTLQPGEEIAGILVFRRPPQGPLTARLAGSEPPAVSPTAPDPKPDPKNEPAETGDFR